MSRTISSAYRAALIAVTALVSLSMTAQGQVSKLNNPLPAKVFYACYIPTSGVVYRIKEADLKQTCSSADHVMFS